MSLGMIVESPEASSPQRRFILKPVVPLSTPLITINATVELRAAGAAAALQYLCRIDEAERRKGKALVDQRRDGKQRLARRQAELEKVQAEIEALKLEERRLTHELDREQQQESVLQDACRRAKKVGVGMKGMILDMQRFMELCDGHEWCLEHHGAYIRAAEEMLAFAIEMGHDSLARAFIDQAANVDKKRFSEKTALHHAVCQGHREIIQLLIFDKSADVNATDREGATPLHTATERGFEDIVHLLLQNGADMAAKTWKGDTPLDLALRSGIKREQISKLLRRYEAEVFNLHQTEMMKRFEAPGGRGG
jgi:hypothetical protein